MKIEQIYTGCLAHGAYYIESNGEAAIIDPLRETQPYLERAQKNGATIKYILETHFHADFVSGHLDLASKTGATIVYGPTAQANFDIMVAEDRQILHLGNVTIEVIHTPGHTMESSCFLLRDEDGKPHSLYSGDTLFIGDVGRPDLAVKTDLSKEQLAGFLYNSLKKIESLPGHIILYPGHGQGSACGKNMSSEKSDTLENQLKLNYALQPMTEAEFVKAVLEGQTPPPSYFPKNAVLNKMGYENLDSIMARGSRALTADQFEQMAKDESALILDTRKDAEYAKGHIPGSIFIGIDGNFAPWVGTLVPDLSQPILLVGEADRISEIITRLSRVGYDNTLGFLSGGMKVWTEANKPVDTLTSISPESFAKQLAANPIHIVDVRRVSEYESGHIEGAENIPLDFINDSMDAFKPEEQYYLHCKGGYRSVVMASILQSRGITNLVNIEGGFDAIAKTNVPITDALALG